MICLEIWVNGIKEYLIGSADAEEFGASIIAVPKTEPTHVSLDLSGFILNDKKYPNEIRWDSIHHKIGDEITIKVIESDTPDKPQLIKYDEGIVGSDKPSQAMICSNCGKAHFETDKWVRTSKITVCNECVKLMAEMLEKDQI